MAGHSWATQFDRFLKRPLKWLVGIQNSHCRYLKASTGFHEHTEKTFNGVGSHLAQLWMQEIELFNSEHFQNWTIVSEFAHF